MPDAIEPLRSTDVDPAVNPTGEQLLDRAQAPFRVWVPGAQAIVLGNSQAPEMELNLDAVRQDGIPVHKRMSGGGAVLLSPGCLCLGLRFAKRKELGIHDYFAKASTLISAIVKDHLDLELRLRGTSDLACKLPVRDTGMIDPGSAETESSVQGLMERKVAGCAMYMPRDYVLYLVSILVEPDFTAIEKYLAHPTKEPEYRSGRTHRDFLAGLGPLTAETRGGRPLNPGDMISWFTQKIPDWPGLDLDWELVVRT
jgi:lipoate---protein ligase